MRSKPASLATLLAVVWIAAHPVAAQDETSDASSGTSMSEIDREILARGEYSRDVIISGGLLGTILGFGTGHAVQSRYAERGWIFTVGELGTLSAGGIGLVSCGDDLGGLGCSVGVAVGTLAVFAGFRVWEAIDVWAHPYAHNRRYRELSAGSTNPQVSLFVAPTPDGGGAAGLAVQF